MDKKIKVIVCEDIKGIRKYIVSSLKEDDEILVVGEAESGKECIELVKNTLPDVLLLDLQIDYQEAGFKVLREVNNISPHIAPRSCAQAASAAHSISTTEHPSHLR